MAFGNRGNIIGSMSYAGRIVERTTKGGKNAGQNQEYISFTVVNKKARKCITYRVYYKSTYTPNSGKHSGVLSCPVTATMYDMGQPQQNNFNNNMIW